MKFNSKIVLFACLGFAGLTSCLKPKEYPIEPVVEYRDFKIYGDTAHLFVGFTDGDGDIGLNEDEDSPPYDTSSIFYYNLFLKYYERVNGAWVAGIDGLGNNIEFNYRIQVITPEGQNKALKGEIRVTLSPLFYNPASPDSDTIMYSIQLADRALHLSNVAESDPIIR